MGIDTEAIINTSTRQIVAIRGVNTTGGGTPNDRITGLYVPGALDGWQASQSSRTNDHMETIRGVYARAPSRAVAVIIAPAEHRIPAIWRHYEEVGSQNLVLVRGASAVGFGEPLESLVVRGNGRLPTFWPWERVRTYSAGRNIGVLIGRSNRVEDFRHMIIRVQSGAEMGSVLVIAAPLDERSWRDREGDAPLMNDPVVSRYGSGNPGGYNPGGHRPEERNPYGGNADGRNPDMRNPGARPQNENRMAVRDPRDLQSANSNQQPPAVLMTSSPLIRPYPQRTGVLVDANGNPVGTEQERWTAGLGLVANANGTAPSN